MKYTEEHEWLRAEDDVVVVGITAHASEQLGDVVFVELPEVGTEVAKDDDAVVIESVKAASDILAPIDGEIVEVNEVLADEPGKVNEDPKAMPGSSRSSQRSHARWTITWTKPPIRNLSADMATRCPSVRRRKHRATLPKRRMYVIYGGHSGASHMQERYRLRFSRNTRHTAGRPLDQTAGPRPSLPVS